LSELIQQRRIELLRELASSLRLAQGAVLKSEPGQMNAQTRRQHELCDELRRLMNGGVVARHMSMESGLPSSSASARVRREMVQVELAEAAKQVDGLNRVYGALLRRARRTAEIFCRILVNSGVTYLPPAPPAASAMRNSRG
jgi:hypothetical protein